METPPDPKKDDKEWKDITERCKPLVKEFLAKATELFGPPTKLPDPLVRVTELERGLRVCFHNEIAYIRILPGMGSNEHDLKAHVAHEIVHVLLKKDSQNTVLEEGLCTYFAVNYGEAYPPHADNPREEKYYEAFAAVTELLKKYPDVIKYLRKPPRSIDKISADEIREACPDYPGDFNRLVSKFGT